MADELGDLLRACTVRVVGGSSQGAGFFVAPGKVLTCAHVVGDNDALMVRWEGDGLSVKEARVSGRVAVLEGRGRPILALDRDYPDIAVLEVEGLHGHPCVDIDTDWPFPGDSLQTLGYRVEGGAALLAPALLTYRGVQGSAPTVFLDLASDRLKRGMSGAAVLNLRTGGVCGVLVAIENTALPDGGLAVPLSAVEADLQEVLAANRAFNSEDGRWDAARASLRERLQLGSFTRRESELARIASLDVSGDRRNEVTGHAFISYTREDSEQVDRLQRLLQAAGVPVWRDTTNLWPGEDWRAKIRHAITDNALVFVACFSRKSLVRRRSYQNEELILAIEQLRQRPPERPWLIPVRFDDCEIPDRDIGAGRTLTSIQRADLFGDRYDEGVRRLVAAILRVLAADSDSIVPESGPASQEGAQSPTEPAPNS